MTPLRFLLLGVAAGICAHAETARTHFDFRRETVAAYQRKDYPAMIAAGESALALRPDSPRYHFNLAVAYAQAGRPDDALATLHNLAALGVSMPVGDSADLAPLREHPGFQAVLAGLAANLRPLGAANRRHEFPAQPGILEGIAWRRATGELFVSDVHRRGVWRIGDDGRLMPFSQPDGLPGAFGLAVDEPRQALWVATGALPEMAGFTPADAGRAALAEIDLTTGRLRRLLPLPADGRPHLLGDLTLAADGTVYLTDSLAPVIWQLAPGADHLEAWCESAAFTSLQGLALIDGGRSLLVSDYANGLFRIDRDTRSVHPLAPPPRATLLGIDGLLAHGDSILAVQNGVTPQRVLRLTLSPAGDRIERCEVLASGLPDLVDLTLPALIDGRLVVIAGGGWARFDTKASPPPPGTVRILQIPLPD